MRLIDMAGSMILRAAVPELPAVNVFGAQGDPDACNDGVIHRRHSEVSSAPRLPRCR